MAADPQHELLKGIQAKWNATAAISAIGALHRWDAPPNKTQRPYVVIRDEPATDAGMTAVSQLFDHSLEFRVHHESPALASVEVAKIDQVFSSDSLSLTLSGISLVSCRLVRPTYEQLDDGIWYAGLGYRLQTSRARIA